MSTATTEAEDRQVGRHALRTFGFDYQRRRILPISVHPAPGVDADVWAGGTCVAVCGRGRTHEVPDPGCTCGIYGASNLLGLIEQFPGYAHTVVAVIAAEGIASDGPHGMRTAAARVVAYWMYPGPAGGPARSIMAQVCTGARQFDDVEDMIAAYGMRYTPPPTAETSPRLVPRGLIAAPASSSPRQARIGAARRAVRTVGGYGVAGWMVAHAINYLAGGQLSLTAPAHRLTAPLNPHTAPSFEQTWTSVAHTVITVATTGWLTAICAFVATLAVLVAAVITTAPVAAGSYRRMWIGAIVRADGAATGIVAAFVAAFAGAAGVVAPLAIGAAVAGLVVWLIGIAIAPPPTPVSLARAAASPPQPTPPAPQAAQPRQALRNRLSSNDNGSLNCNGKDAHHGQHRPQPAAYRGHPDHRTGTPRTTQTHTTSPVYPGAGRSGSVHPDTE